MEISLLQAFALGIIAFIAGTDMFNGLTHIHRPVVLKAVGRAGTWRSAYRYFNWRYTGAGVDGAGSAGGRTAT